MDEHRATRQHPMEWVRSDHLAQLRQFFGQHAAFLNAVRPLFRTEVIIDANVVIRDLIRLAKRGDCQGRSWIQELCAAGTLMVYAPPILDAEVRRNLACVAKKRHISLRAMMDHWEAYSRNITFVDVPTEVGPLDMNVRHPNDLPYIRLQQKTDALIYTNDKDIPAMGGRTIGYTVIAHLRDYSRNAAVELMILYQGIVVARVGADVTRQTFSFLRSLSVHARKLPYWVWLLGGAALLMALLHARVRRLVISFISSLPPKARELGSTLALMTEPLIVTYSEAKTNADAALESAILEIEESTGGETKHACEIAAP